MQKSFLCINTEYIRKNRKEVEIVVPIEQKQCNIEASVGVLDVGAFVNPVAGVALGTPPWSESAVL